MTAGEMIATLAGLQAQDVRDPYLALWSRIASFRHDDLGRLLQDRTAVRASLMRGTIHLVTAADYQAFFPITYALHVRAVNSVSSARLIPREHHQALATWARALLTGNPLTAAQIGEALAPDWPQFERHSLSQVVRFLLPLVQVPPRGVWGPRISTLPIWALPVDYLGVEVAEEIAPAHELVRRYLRAFGPASLPDMAAWSGIGNFRPVLKDLADELATYRNEDGVVLYDLAGLEIVDADVPAPVRFLPGFDNGLLGHKDRRRIIADPFRAAITTVNGMFASTFTVDGFVAGTWRVVDGAVQTTAFAELTPAQWQDVEAEAALMLSFWTARGAT